MITECPKCSRAVEQSQVKCKCGALLLRLSWQPKQRQLVELAWALGPDVPTKLGYGGSRGSSKSRAGRDLALFFAFSIPRITIYVVTRNLDKADENYIQKYRIERPELMQYYRAAKPPSFEFPEDLGGSRIVFRYGDTLDDLIGVGRGPEAYIIIVEQAELFSEAELDEINKPNRWPGAPAGATKTVYLFNPGGPGTDYLRRVFFVKQYKGTERPGDFAFIQAYGWDNYEWFREEVPEVDGKPLTFEYFYALPGDCPANPDGKYDDKWLATLPDNHRFKIFVTRTSEGKKYWGKSDATKLGDLFGRFDLFAGQYFAGVWDERLCVLPSRVVDAMVPYWWPPWVSMDWGFGHYCAVYWLCTGKLSPSQAWEFLQIDTDWPLDVVIVYRELVTQRTAEVDLAKKIVEMTPERERAEIRKFVAGSDTKTTDRWAPHTVRELIDSVTVPAGFPPIRGAQDGPGSRVINARLLYEGFRRTSSMRGENPPKDRPEEKTAPLLLISAECPQLIAAVPLLITDEKKVEDVQKLETVADDCFDSCKYGYAEYLAVRDLAPREVRRAETWEAAGSNASDAAERNTARAMAMRRFDHDEEQQERRGRKR